MSVHSENMFLSTSTLSVCILLTAIFEAAKGQGNLTSNDRIMNGNVATSPPTYMVSVQVLNRSKKKANHKCAGVIIDLDRVATQASCVLSEKTSNLVVRAGVSDLSSNLGSIHTVVDYRINGTLFNIMTSLVVLFVRPPFVQGPQISVKNITANITFNEDDTVLIYGWGQVDPGGYLSPSKNQVLITKVLSNHLCHLIYPNLDPNTALCMQAQVGKGTSKGDAGGPVILQATGQLIAIIADVSLQRVTVMAGLPSVGSLLGGPLQFVENNFPVISVSGK